MDTSPCANVREVVWGNQLVYWQALQYKPVVGLRHLSRYGGSVPSIYGLAPGVSGPGRLATARLVAV